jgi:small basic protein
MFRVETTSIIPQPHIIASFAEKESKTIVVVGAVCTCTLKKTMDQKNRISSFFIPKLILDVLVQSIVFVGEYLG